MGLKRSSLLKKQSSFYGPSKPECCGNIETDNETGRYQVIEKKQYKFLEGVNYNYHHTYFLLDTKTGEIKKIDFEEIE